MQGIGQEEMACGLWQSAEGRGEESEKELTEERNGDAIGDNDEGFTI